MPLYESNLMIHTRPSDTDIRLREGIEILLDQIDLNISSGIYSPKTSECIDKAYLRTAYIIMPSDDLPRFEHMLKDIAQNRLGCSEIESRITEIIDFAYH